MNAMSHRMVDTSGTRIHVAEQARLRCVKDQPLDPLLEHRLRARSARLRTQQINGIHNSAAAVRIPRNAADCPEIGRRCVQSI